MGNNYFNEQGSKPQKSEAAEAAGTRLKEEILRYLESAGITRRSSLISGFPNYDSDLIPKVINKMVDDKLIENVTQDDSLIMEKQYRITKQK